MTSFVGVDGGGTSVRAVIVDAEGRVLGRGEAPGAPARASRPDEAASAVRLAVEAAAEQARIELPARVLWAGLAGAGSDPARNAVLELLDDGSLADHVGVETDVDIAYADAFGAGPGVLLVAGTGSIAVAANGRACRRVGGWGPHVGDEGGGYAIGMAALRAVVRMHDGREPRTGLPKDVLAHIGVDRVDGLPTWIDTASKREIASLAPLVVRRSEEGDASARAIVDRAVDDLVELVQGAVAATAPWTEDAALVLWGGLLTEAGPLRSRLIAALHALPVRLSEVELDPARGAALRARGSF